MPAAFSPPTPRPITPSRSPPNAPPDRWRARSSIFGPVVGVTTSNVSRSAIAVFDPKASANGIILLDPSDDNAMYRTGSGSITINNGNLVVDSNNASAVNWGSGGTLTAQAVFVTAGGSGTVDGVTTYWSQPPLPDPLGSLAAPPKPGTSTTSTSTSGTLQPGYYPNGINCGSNSVTLAKGTYWLDKGTSLHAINQTGSGTFNASAGCLLYIHTGDLNLNGSGGFAVAPLNDASAYANVCVYQDRSDSSADTINGSGSYTNSGIIYLPASAVTYTGSGVCNGTQLICYTLKMTGTSAMVINFNPNIGAVTDTAQHVSYLAR